MMESFEELKKLIFEDKNHIVYQGDITNESVIVISNNVLTKIEQEQLSINKATFRKIVWIVNFLFQVKGKLSEYNVLYTENIAFYFSKVENKYLIYYCNFSIKVDCFELDQFISWVNQMDLANLKRLIQGKEMDNSKLIKPFYFFPEIRWKTKESILYLFDSAQVYPEFIFTITQNSKT